MNGLLNAERLTALAQQAWAWVLTHVLVLATALQLAVSGVALAVAILVARKLRPKLAALSVKPALKRPVFILSDLLMPLIWLSLQWLATLTAQTMGWPSYVLELVATLLTAWAISTSSSMWAIPTARMS